MEDLYEQYRALLFTIAYQLTGSAADAEDAVQDVFVKAFDVRFTAEDNKKAYLCKMVTNRCLDILKSARKQREVYVGPWLPEPIRTAGNDAFEAVENRDLLSYAMLVLLERLTPTERAVFVLREALGFDYSEIAAILDKQTANCRKLMSRAKSRLKAADENALHKGWVVKTGSEPSLGVELIEPQWFQHFLTSLENGNIDEVMALLHENVTVITDGGGRVLTATRPIRSRDHVLRYLLSTFELIKQYHHDDFQFKVAPLNGENGLVLRAGNETISAMIMQRHRGKLDTIYVIRNPEKLTRV